MRKILFFVLCSLLLISCSKDGKTTEEHKTVDSSDIVVDMEDIRFRHSRDDKTITWFYSQYEKRISMWLREDNSSKFDIHIADKGMFKSYIARFSNSSVCSFLGDGDSLLLNVGRNTVSIKGKAKGNTMLRIYGINNSEEEILISGFDNEEDNTTLNKDLRISVYPRDYVETVMEGGTDENYIVDSTDILSLIDIGKQFPKTFSLERREAGYLAYRDTFYRNQGSCYSCSYFSAVGLLEVETKRQLTEDKNFPVSKYNINLSEKELLDKRDLGNIGAHVYDNLKDLSKNGWIIPLEKYNPYPKSGENNCVWSYQNAVNHYSGIKVKKTRSHMIANSHKVDFINDKIETRVKSLIFLYDKAVSVAIDWPISSWGRSSQVIEGDEIYGINRRHAVSIIGWDDNYVDADSVVYGKVWIAQNSHNKNRSTFYIKMGNIANPSSYTYIDDVVIEGYDSFVGNIANPAEENNWHNEIPFTKKNVRMENGADIGGSGISNKNDYIGHIMVEKFGDFKILRNPKDAMPNIPNIPDISAPQTLKNVELHKVEFKISRKGINYTTVFPKTVGIAGIKDNPFFRYCEITNKDENYIYFATWTLRVGEIFGENGKIIEDAKWIPCKPEECAVGYIYEPYR